MAGNLSIGKRFYCMVLFGVLLSGLLSHAKAQQKEQSRQLKQPETTLISGRRLALVIGNGNYQNASKLNNTINDARDIALLLRVLGFDVVEREDQTADQMKRLIKEFGERLSQGQATGLFYFAGHGVQVNGKNYLVPVEAKNLREKFIEFDAVDVGRVLSEMEDAANGINIVILDACRSNPFKRSWRSAESGLAQINTPKGTLIAYATAPGSVADDGNERNGLYTSELIRWMKQPGLTIEEMFKRVRAGVSERSGGKQTPTESTMLIGDFYFTSLAKEAKNQAGTDKGELASNTSDIELIFWETIRGSNNPEDFKAYLNAYPNGRFIGLAKIRSQQLKRGDGIQQLEEVVQRGKQRAGRPANKAGKILLSWGVLDDSNSDKKVSEIFDILNEFLPSLVTSLQQGSLTVTSLTQLSPGDYRQVSGATLQIENGGKASARSVPFSINVHASIGVEDLPLYSGMYISVAKITLKAFDLEAGQIIAEENIVDAKGFGVDREQARRNALREASQKIPATFINKVAESAR